jgi:hypothetical protein
MRKDDHLIFEALQDNQKPGSGSKSPSTPPGDVAGGLLSGPRQKDKLAVSNPSKYICNKLKQIYNLLQELEEVYEHHGREIDKNEVISSWDAVIPEVEYLYYVMKGQYNKINDDGEVLRSITGIRMPGEPMAPGENAEGQSVSSNIQNQNPASGKKYAALIVDDSGEAFLQGIDEAELKDYVGGHNTAEKTNVGVKFYSDGEDGCTILLGQIGMEEFKRVLNSTSPFFPNKHDYNSWLNSIQDEQD